MSQFPNSPDLGNQSQSGDSVFENVWVFGKLNYTFENDDLGIRSIDVREPSIFKKTVTATSFNGPATQVTVEDENVDTECFPIFSKDSTGNVEPKTGTTLRFNSSNGTLRAEKFSGDGSLLTNITAGQVQGNSIFVSGMIILWSGAEADIPTGFVLCNGSYSTPDLRSRFVVGAGTGSNYSVNDTGGNENTTLTTGQLPSHTHTFTTGDPSPTQTGTVRKISESFAGFGGSATGVFTKVSGQNAGGTPGSPDSNNTGGLNFDGTHTHSGTTAAEGSGSAIENRPPYYALCYIMKT